MEEIKKRFIDDYHRNLSSGVTIPKALEELSWTMNRVMSQLYSEMRLTTKSKEKIHNQEEFIQEHLASWLNVPRIIPNDTLTPISYEFPKKNGNHPFDLSCEDKYFIDARGLTFSYTEYMDESAIYHSEKIIKAIPMGRKSICLFEKIRFIKKGHVVKSFEDRKEQSDGKHYFIVSTSKFLRRTFYTNYVDTGQIDCCNLSEINEEAIEFSQKDPIGLYLICKLNADIFWH